jgi:hypothetical protein
MKKKLISLAAFIALIGFNCGAYAQQKEDSDQQTSGKRDDIETIEVIGRKSLNRLRLEVEENALTLANVFNAYIDDPDLRFICEKKQLPGSRRTKEVCESGFEKRIREQLRGESLGARGGADFNALSQADLFARAGTGEIDRKRQEQQLAMTQLARENPQFLAAVIRFNKSKEALHKNHERVYGRLSNIRDKDAKKAAKALGQ